MFCDKCGTENRDTADYCSSCGSKIQENQKSPDSPKPEKSDSAGDKTKSTFIEKFKEIISDRYEVIRELGRGGMAIVFLAKDNRLDRQVALKLLPEQFHHDQSFRERFLREAKISAKLSHPNIIQIHDVNEVRGFTYYSMSYIEGVSLAQIIRKGGAISPKIISRLGIQICFALQNAHEKNVVHRDIKPENILVNKKRMPIVVDFGIAKALTEAKLSQTGMIIGTPHYMSPEQIKTGVVDGRSDIYSLGCVLYEMAVGKTPFQGLDPTSLMYHQVNELPPPPHTKNTEIPEALSNIIMRALAKNPDERFQTASELGKALHNMTTGAAPPVKEAEAASGKQIKKPADKSADASDYEATVIAQSGPQKGQAKAARDGAIGDTLATPKFKDKSKSREKSSKGIGMWVGVGIFGLLAAITIGALLLYPEKPKVPLQTSQPGKIAVETDKSKVPDKPSPVDSKTKTSRPAAPTSSVSKQQKAPAPPPSQDTQVTKTVDSRKTTDSKTTVEKEPPVSMKESVVSLRELAPDATKTVEPEQKAPAPAEPEREQLAVITKPEVEKVPEVAIPEKKPEKPVEKPVTPPPKTSITINWKQIPGGTFLMGDSQGDMDDQFACRPVHRVTVSPFEMSRDEITVEQYAFFLKETGHSKPDNWNEQLSNPKRPVVFVSWHDAAAFARWAGARLPTEAEWEYASRSRLEGKKYSWGDISPSGRANFNNPWEKGMGWKKYLKEPGSFTSNRFGLNDMTGN
ncbi:MAG TPA: zinc-ribbon domain-containing protein, partial [bacterium]|nr:zinc-ribbon domain-containing protein [bacterium]